MYPNRQPPDYHPHKTGMLVNWKGWETVWCRPAGNFGRASKRLSRNCPRRPSAHPSTSSPVTKSPIFVGFFGRLPGEGGPFSRLKRNFGTASKGWTDACQRVSPYRMPLLFGMVEGCQRPEKDSSRIPMDFQDSFYGPGARGSIRQASTDFGVETIRKGFPSRRPAASPHSRSP